MLGLVDDLRESQVYEARTRFRFAFSAIEKLEAGQVNEAAFSLYTIAKMSAKDLSQSESPEPLASELERFSGCYPRFLQEQCNINIIGVRVKIRGRSKNKPSPFYFSS